MLQEYQIRKLKPNVTKYARDTMFFLKENKIGALVGFSYAMFQINLYQILQFFETCSQPPTGCEELVTSIWMIDIIPKTIFLVIVTPFTISSEYPPPSIALFAIIVAYFVFILFTSKLEQLVRKVITKKLQTKIG